MAPVNVGRRLVCIVMPRLLLGTATPSPHRVVLRSENGRRTVSAFSEEALRRFQDSFLSPRATKPRVMFWCVGVDVLGCSG